jgi:hypothetical protein
MVGKATAVVMKKQLPPLDCVKEMIKPRDRDVATGFKPSNPLIKRLGLIHAKSSVWPEAWI